MGRLALVVLAAISVAACTGVTLDEASTSPEVAMPTAVPHASRIVEAPVVDTEVVTEGGAGPEATDTTSNSDGSLVSVPSPEILVAVAERKGVPCTRSAPMGMTGVTWFCDNADFSKQVVVSAVLGDETKLEDVIDPSRLRHCVSPISPPNSGVNLAGLTVSLDVGAKGEGDPMAALVFAYGSEAMYVARP